MKIFAGTGREGDGSHFGFIANLSVLLAIAAVAVAMLLDRVTRAPDAPLVALFAPKVGQPAAQTRQLVLRQGLLPRFDKVDATPTASIGAPIILDPCLGKTK